ncbi:MAG: hypothetical protein HYX40_01000 [Sphingobacteriales bacterium]|nr:hypothetical protein [Sphingobacteriales bacterium]
METRIILATLCFALSFLSLIRGYYLIRAEQQQSHSGTFINATDTITALKLIFFNGIKSRNGIVLMFKTDNTVAHYCFEIERKDVNGNYTTIFHIERPETNKSYSFTDSTYTTDHTEYRLKQTNLSGNSKISKPVLISRC